ncbi:microsomal signal peptidase 25 kDa subunit-domain-containing protein [Dendryphion nanum]|uniref:Signal peptidase complex subunit 2 n=1 Tax=Dendryphion nanum TaxID=256645 RepID=A0A9P9CZ23_9PLEO|nr:microsomal signal peptidase 25 kDa subunit-domain-containing protein [Dendryphion nanum]
MTAPTKIAVHSLADLKNTTDDHLPQYLHNLKFRQIHRSTDVRLALGYSAVVIAGVLFYFDWKFGWDATKVYTAPAVGVYFILNGLFTWWVWWVEAGLVYEGEGKGVGKLRLTTSTQKHIPVYNLVATFSLPGTTLPQTITLRAPFTRWFTSDGYFAPKPFQQWLASEIPVIGAADPTNVVEEIGRGSETERVLNASGNNAIDILEQLKKGASAGAPQATGAGVGGGSGRRRKA